MGGGIYNPDTGTFDFDEVAGPEPVPEAGDQLRSLTVESAAALLRDAHNVGVSPDDPILMVVTLQRRFLQDLQAVLKIHDKAIEAAITSTATTTVDAVNGALETLKDRTVRAGLSNAMALVEQQGAAMEAFQAGAKRHLRIITALTLTSWLGLAVVLGLLWSLLR